MSRQKKTRRITDIMPARKIDKKSESALHSGKKLTRHEQDAKAREEKRKRKHKGLASGSRHSAAENQDDRQEYVAKDPRLGSRKKVPLIVEFVNKPEKGQIIPSVKTMEKPTALVLRASLEKELESLENNECLNQLLDELDAGKKLTTEDQKFVDECLLRIDYLMNELGIKEEEENIDDLYHTFEKININQFK